MADHQTLRMHHAVLHLGRQQTRGRRTEHHIRPGHPAGRGQQLLLQLHALRHAFLDEVGSVDGLLRRADEAERTLRRQRRHRQLGVRPAGVGQHLANLAGRFRIGIEHRHVDGR